MRATRSEQLGRVLCCVCLTSQGLKVCSWFDNLDKRKDKRKICTNFPGLNANLEVTGE